MGKTSVAIGSNRISSFVLFAAIAGAPLPFGSRDPITVAIWCFFLGFGLLFASVRRLQGGHILVLTGIGITILCYGFVLHEQLAESPWVAAPNPIWASASDVLGKSLRPSVSIVRDEPFYALGPSLAALLALILGLVVGADYTRARQAISVMAWAGTCYALYGIFTFLFEPTTILWREKTAYIGSLTGTFINRNTAATYFGSCAIVWLVLLMERARGRLPRGGIVWTKVPNHLLSDTPMEFSLGFGMFFVCMAALFLTNSRGGVIFSLLVFVIAFVLYFRRDLPRGKGLVIIFLCSGAVAIIALQFFGSNIGARIDSGGLSDQGRLATWRSTLHIIADSPWFGTGLGTFAWAFPRYRGSEESMLGIWDAAHSTPLELASELGAPLAVLFCVCWIVAMAVLLRALRGSRRQYAVPLSAFSVGLLALLHSAIDFSLQVAGYAIVVFALIGVGLGQSFGGNETVSSHLRRTRTAEKIQTLA